MTKRKTILVFVIILAGLCAATAITLAVQEFSTPGETAEAEPILVLDSGNITEINVSNANGEFAFSKEGDQWIYETNPNISIKQDVPETIADAISSMTAINTVTNPENTSDYGMDSPSAVVNVSEENNYEIIFGNTTNTGADRYTSVGDGNIYVTEALLYAKINFTEEDLLENDTIPEISAASSVTMSVDGNEATITDVMDVDSILSTIRNISLSECVNPDADDSDLTSYGLVSPCLNIKIAYNNADGEQQTLSFDISVSADENGCYYIKLNDSAKVYTLDTDTATSLLTAYYEAIR